MMNTQEMVYKGPVAVILAFSSYMLNVFTEVVLILVILMLIDYLTGLLRGWIYKEANSRRGIKGIGKKIGMLFVVGMSACLEFVLQHLGLSTNSAIVVVVSCFYIFNESISILENCGQLGVPLPKILYDSLEKLKDFGGGEYKPRKPKVKKEGDK